MPAFELHVWGPAFGLPSIDAECLAAIAYLHYTLPSSEWTLIPSSDPSLTPQNRLPALRSTASGTWAAGYDAVVSHLAHETTHHLDVELTDAQRADAVAYSSYISSHIAPLLDLTLYALPRNWTQTTRSAYGAIIPFPLTWTVPIAQRAAAVERVSHLVASLPLSDGNDDAAAQKDLSALDAAIKHLPTSRKKGILEQMAPAEAATIRLHAMAVDALSVLEDLRRHTAQNSHDSSPTNAETSSTNLRLLRPGQVTSLDCLAFGYLSLAASAPVPQDFLRKVLTTRFPALLALATDIKRTCLETPGTLPWTPYAVRDTMGGTRILVRFLDDVLRVTPTLGDLYATEHRRRAEIGTADGSFLDKRTAALASGALALGSALTCAAWWYRNLPSFGLRSQTWVAGGAGAGRLAEFGALGAMLDFSLAGPATGHGAEHQQNRIVEAEVGLD
ncbi:hypothetical protein SODALDRAFT_332161 [Sodiomyces alkalinus F11]|uniref:Mitochondrial outer membrane transport complex Sam37/metaxin N-terminal domain-containing protein n=1 Tax=Sodiomyces alkalinus (strain CBS 110278 / VKM F-3762 / F11) TaxID=1314773 RepID=A0A3N2PZR1_SODAK|nr:hypothetical protein SODALDRAFT_332161 [Sodiomyces alkalinus F11]ROT40010.1 hypothetical protein SODALDRAFT_332161 [Sodiomyces alkalinus F11]